MNNAVEQLSVKYTKTKCVSENVGSIFGHWSARSWGEVRVAALVTLFVRMRWTELVDRDRSFS